MSGKGDSLILCLVGNSEICVWWYIIEDLYKICALLFNLPDTISLRTRAKFTLLVGKERAFVYMKRVNDRKSK